MVIPRKELTYNMFKFMILFLCIFFDSSQSHQYNNGTKFHIVWHDGIKPCEYVENNLISTDELVFERFNGTLTTLSGDLVLQEDTPRIIKLIVKIDKKILGNWEQYMTLEMEDFCKELEAEERIWTPFVAALNITGCPIPKNVYKVKNIAMPISDFGGEPLKAFFAGEYFNKFEFYDEDKLIGCIMTKNSVEPE